MEDGLNLISAIDNLTSEECDRLKQILAANKIPFIIYEHGAHGEYKSFYFGIKVKHNDLPLVKKIAAKHKAKVFIDRLKCPECGNLKYNVLKKTRLIDKLFFMGTTLVECAKCKTKYGI